MKFYIAIAGFAALFLAAAAVWFGGLNQDEGWYLYAAQLVGEGKMPYRDFFYTQGPLMPFVYQVFGPLWRGGGILGARIFTCVIGFIGILFAAALARALVPAARKGAAATVTFILLATNLFHLYYNAIPKTYALASLLVASGYFCVCHALANRAAKSRVPLLIAGGVLLALAAGTRISLGALLAVCGFGLLFAFRHYRWDFLWFGIGGAAGLALVYGPFLLDAGAFKGLVAAQQYHAARGGFDAVFTIGSVSRLVRWYLPVFVIAGLGIGHLVMTPSAAEAPRRDTSAALANEDGGTLPRRLVLAGFLAVFAVQMLVPFPYEDYQVPIMGLFAVYAAALAARIGSPLVVLLALGMSFASSFGSPLLEKWMIVGQDRFWAIKKERSELSQLREMAAVINALDPGGKELLTQDLYLAIESGRRVPAGLEMGPFSILTDAQWRELLATTQVPIAALSGYSFAIEPPRCAERSLEEQNAYWRILRERYDLVFREDNFGQNSTPLLVLKKKGGAK